MHHRTLSCANVSSSIARFRSTECFPGMWHCARQGTAQQSGTRGPCPPGPQSGCDRCWRVTQSGNPEASAKCSKRKQGLGVHGAQGLTPHWDQAELRWESIAHAYSCEISAGDILGEGARPGIADSGTCFEHTAGPAGGCSERP